MTKEQQKVVDSFHTRVISLMLKRSRAQRLNNYTEEERITKEIEKLEDERRQYERQQKPPRTKESEIKGSVPAEEAGAEQREAKTEV
jgi:hypothetical protein